MNLSTALLVAVLAVGVLAVALGVWTRLTGVLRTRYRRRVLVTLKDATTVDGLLWSADSTALVLRLAKVVDDGPGAAPIPLDGELILLLVDVAHIQRP